MSATVDTLQTLISMKTVTSDKQANYEALMWCQNYLNNKNVLSKLEIINDQPLLWWGCKPEKAEIMINSHIDVVPGSDAIFTPKITGDRLFGRGSLDTKSSIASYLDLPETTIKSALDKKIIFVLVSDEEIGGPSTKAFLPYLTKLKFSVFGGPTGIGIAYEDQGIIQVKVNANGVSAHGSRPWLGKNAIERVNEGLTSFLKGNSTPRQETKATTFNFSMISGGTAINQVPSTCELLIDVRFNPKDNPNIILREIKGHFKLCEVMALKTESHIYTDPAHPLNKKLSKALKSNGVIPQFSFDHGSSDARHCTAKRIPAVIFGPTGKNLHSEKEWVDMKSVVRLGKIMEDFINSL